MQREQPKIDPHASDPARWGHSLQNLAEILLSCLDAVGSRAVVEVGAYAGDLTGVLVDWAAASSAQVIAIDPAPQERLVRLADERAELELVRETSLVALPRLGHADAVIIDGDHNYFTVSQELRAIAAASGDELPLLIFHDVGWPHGRRDDYYAPEQIPAEHRQPIHDGGGLFPGDPGIRPGALPYRSAAAREGGPRNGVLTAVEDFAAEHGGLRLAIVPAFFGLGVLWREDAPWSEGLGAALAPWDRNAVLSRLEDNRVYHLASANVYFNDALRAQQRAARQEAVLRRLLESSAFAVAERLSRLRLRAGIAPAQPAVSREEIRRALEQ